MHLLLAQKGSISDGDEAIDLGQTPGDVLFLSAADTELAAIAAAVEARGGEALRWRLASLMTLKHPMSVDTYIERTARHARLIVVRALGGASYFHYALEALHASARRSGAAIVVLPGDDKPDEGLLSFQACEDDDRRALWTYLTEGGAGNAEAFVAYAEAMLHGVERPEPARPLLKAGIWWPGRGVIGVEEWERLAFAAPPSDLQASLPSASTVPSSRAAKRHPSRPWLKPCRPRASFLCRSLSRASRIRSRSTRCAPSSPASRRRWSSTRQALPSRPRAPKSRRRCSTRPAPWSCRQSSRPLPAPLGRTRLKG